jgi:hypothetical protein
MLRILIVSVELSCLQRCMWDSEELSCLLRLQDSEDIPFLWNFLVGEDVCRILRIFFRLGKFCLQRYRILMILFL